MDDKSTMETNIQSEVPDSNLQVQDDVSESIHKNEMFSYDNGAVVNHFMYTEEDDNEMSKMHPIEDEIDKKLMRQKVATSCSNSANAQVNSNTCPECGKSFTRPHTVTIHMRLHTGETPYVCEICNKKFIFSGELSRHKKSHTGEKVHVCSVCQKSFTRADGLKEHVRTHTGELPYPCGVCDKKFRTSGNLSAHMKCHTGERTHPCQTCGKCFKYSSLLKRHIKQVHT